MEDKKLEKSQLRQLKALLNADADLAKRKRLLDPSFKIISVEQIPESQNWFLCIDWVLGEYLTSDSYACSDEVGNDLKAFAHNFLTEIEWLCIEDECKRLKKLIEDYNKELFRCSGKSTYLKGYIKIENCIRKEPGPLPQVDLEIP